MSKWTTGDAAGDRLVVSGNTLPPPCSRDDGQRLPLPLLLLSLSFLLRAGLPARPGAAAVDSSWLLLFPGERRRAYTSSSISRSSWVRAAGPLDAAAETGDRGAAWLGRAGERTGDRLGDLPPPLFGLL